MGLPSLLRYILVLKAPNLAAMPLRPALRKPGVPGCKCGRCPDMPDDAAAIAAALASEERLNISFIPCGVVGEIDEGVEVIHMATGLNVPGDVPKGCAAG